jgi:GT2 family glycosyltransferase
VISTLIVPVLARHDLLDKMLSSIDYPVQTLVVIDNDRHSNWQVPSLSHIKEFYYLKMPSNLGVATSWNLGIKATPHSNYWLIANFDVLFATGSLAKFDEISSHDKIVLAHSAQPWCAFTIGSTVVEKVGLFDESLHPAYFEDNDMERRCNHQGVVVHRSDVHVSHANSSTLQAGYEAVNARTFSDNAQYYRAKCEREDYSAGEWSIKRRRLNEWKRD